MQAEEARLVDYAPGRTKPRLRSALGALTLLGATMVGCSSPGRSPDEMSGVGGRSDGGAGGVSDGGVSDGGVSDGGAGEQAGAAEPGLAGAAGRSEQPSVVCGDGAVDDGEACDDGNRADGDGCAGDCSLVEPGYSCALGRVCVEERCGDGGVGATEECDDGARAGGDGCSASCKLELGFACNGEPSVCARTNCGNRILEGSETCDDGNAVPFDGCSATCQAEPTCNRGGCTSECGDGLLIDEECDDGNAKDGDGCSSICEIEPGFECSPQGDCEKVNGACVLRVPVIYRDFNYMHADFDVACRGSENGLAETTGLVATALANGVPVVTASAGASCITKLADWYSDAGSPAIVKDLVLFDDGKGAYVNRYGASGEQWVTRPVYTGRWCGNGDSMCLADPGNFPGCDFDSAVDTCFFPCPPELGSAADTCAGTMSAVTKYDGTPLFFPIDEQPKSEVWRDAKVPFKYGYDWLFEDTVVPVYGAPHVALARSHNFNFTTQIASWFKYDAAAAIHLDFTGDDDIWVFVNGRLAVDAGGVHTPVDGSLAFDPATAARLGLADGRVYRIDVFHAERRGESSALRLSLPWFAASRSECTRL